jgi:predicted MFS family arabinose efflux permease
MLGALLATGPLGWASLHVGWRVSMGVAAVCMAAACIGVWRSVKDHGHVDARGRSLWSMCLTSLGLLRIRALWTLLPICVAMAAGTAFRNAWGGPYLADVFHMNADVRGASLAVVSFSGFCTAFLLPGLVRRFDLKPTIGGWSVLALLAGAALTLLPSSNAYLSIGLMAVLASIGMLHPILMAHGRKLFHGSMRGRGLGVMNSFVFLGSALASWAFGAIAGYGSTIGWSAASIYGVIFAVASLTIVAALVPYRSSPR